MGELSPHFSVAEYLATAHRALVDEQLAAWKADPTLLISGRRLAGDILEPARQILRSPLHVTSGYRCGALNRAVGGRPTSRHVLALAADVVPIGLDLRASFAAIAAAVRAGQLPHVDEAILEVSWMHLQAAAEGRPRQLCLVTTDGIRFAAWTQT